MQLATWDRGGQSTAEPHNPETMQASFHSVVYVEDPGDPELICPVCRGPFDEGTVTSRLMCCRNEICETCHAALAAHDIGTCPICRAPLPSSPSPGPTSSILVEETGPDPDPDSDPDLDFDTGPVGPGGGQHSVSPFADLNGVDSETDSESDMDADGDFVPGEPQPMTVWQ